MPRFVGKKPHGLWWDLIALVVLAIIVLVALQVSGTIDLFGSAPGPVPV